jgi:hypothetical protein
VTPCWQEVLLVVLTWLPLVGLLCVLTHTADAQIRWLMHYVRGMVTHYMAAVQHILGNREAQADCYHAQVQGTSAP